MANASDVGARVDGERYCELPEGRRTTYVGGMLDMMEALARHVSADKRAWLDALRRCSGPMVSDTLRKLMDDYMDADASRRQYTAASNFLVALTEKCPS